VNFEEVHEIFRAENILKAIQESEHDAQVRTNKSAEQLQKEQEYVE
jgi:hypothetical protein